MNESYYRYIRHLILPEIGIEGQDILRKSKVLCIGTGGLGSSALIHLACAGVGFLGLVDFDSVDITNLNRQIMFNFTDVGKSKVLCASDYLKKLNPELNIKVYESKFSFLTCFDIMKGYDIVLDCSDNLETRFLINDVAIKLDIPMVHGSVFGFEGYVGIFLRSGACYRCLYDNFKYLNCMNYGILGSVAGIVGSIQALETVKFLLNKFCFLNSFICLDSKLLFLDFKMVDFKVIRVKKKSDCVVC